MVKDFLSKQMLSFGRNILTILILTYNLYIRVAYHVLFNILIIHINYGPKPHIIHILIFNLRFIFLCKINFSSSIIEGRIIWVEAHLFNSNFFLLNLCIQSILCLHWMLIKLFIKVVICLWHTCLCLRHSLKI